MTTTTAAASPVPAESAQYTLSTPRRIGYTLGDYACNLYWQGVSIFLLFFYTDAVGLSAASAGLIYMIASIFDGATDPFAGVIADRTRSRWGRYRPYLLFGGVPLGAAFVLMYYKPPLEGVWLFTWMLVAHLIFRLAYTILSIPYTSLSARMTRSSSERGWIAGGRIFFATLAALTISYFTQPMVAAFGDGDAAWGFTCAAAVFALIATVLFPIVFASAKEPEETIEAPRMRYMDYWKAVGNNRAFWMLMFGFGAAVVCSIAIGKSILYYYKYYLNDEPASRYALTIQAASGLIIVPAWVWVSKQLGKRRAWLAASTIAATGLVYFAFTDITNSTHMIMWLLWVHVGVLGAAFAFWAMLPDSVEYGQLKSGVRAESFIFGVGQFFLKAAIGLGAGLFGWLLDLAGYVPNVEQTPETLQGLRTIMYALPLVGVTGAFIAIYFYPIDKGDHEKIVEELKRREAAGATAGTELAE